MKITRDNYESWFLDYLEGKLEEGMTDEFIRFILENPDLKEELRLFEPVALENTPMVFTGKEKLYKEDFDLPGKFDEAAVASMEGDLDESSADGFSRYVAHHPDKIRELKLFKLTRLQPDLSIVFPAKNRLYRERLIHLTTFRVMQIAAILVLVLVLFPVIQNRIPGPGNEITVNNLPAAIHSSVSGPADLAPTAVNTERKLFANKNEKRNKLPVEITAKSPVRLEGSHPTEVMRRVEATPVLTSLKVTKPVILPQDEPGIALSHSLAETAGLLASNKADQVPLSDKIMEKIGLSDISLGKIARWGLTLASDLTNDKFNVTTDQAGEVVAYCLDTRLLGFSIPARKK